MEARIAGGAGLEFAAISAGKLRRYQDLKLLEKLRDISTMALNVRDLTRLVKGLGQSLRVLRRFDPDVVFIKGGYVGLPVGLAAGILRIPYVIHESDIRPGLTNRILAKRAAAIATGFPAEKYTDLPKSKLVYTGNLVRKELIKAHRLEGLAHFKLRSELPVILVIGGSQGAQAINEALIHALPELLKHYQVIHIAGEKHIEQVRFETSRLDTPLDNYRLYSFLTDDMGAALAAADVVVARSGANTLAELAALAKPAIVIPHPSLEDQQLNATALARAGAIKVLPQGRLSAPALIAQLEQVLSSESEQEYLSHAIAGFAVPDAPERLAKLIVEKARVRTKPESDPEPVRGDE